MRKILLVLFMIRPVALLTATTIDEVEKVCALCQTTSTQIVVVSTNQMGYSDLDRRPPEMMRSTIVYWVQECPQCGYCHTDISEAVGSAAVTVKTDAYRAQLFNAGLPHLADRFLCMLLAHDAAGENHAAYYNALCAAWACDDAQNTEGALKIRRLAGERLETIRNSGGVYLKQSGGDDLLLADLARRTGDFAKVRTLAEAGLALNAEDIIVKLLKYEVELAEAKDSAAHTIQKVLGK
jgi:hypothetical protein